jgi:hypothetical protein
MPSRQRTFINYGKFMPDACHMLITDEEPLG